MTPNKFVLIGPEVEVTYTIGGTPNLSAMTYIDDALDKSFTADEIQSNNTIFGTLVSVALILSVDAGGKRFGVFLPPMDVASDQIVYFRTVGIHESFSGPDSVPRRPSTWRCVEMAGTAQSVILPLGTPTAKPKPPAG